MVENIYDIFISYKRKSLPTANNLYYRLTTRGYSTFFDLEEMRRDNFNIQLLSYIENSKDVFVILEEGSLDACRRKDWKNDWFCQEIAFALEKKKNIIPILLNGYIMPSADFFPKELQELSLKHSPDFSFSFFDAYLDKLIEKKFITSEAHIRNKVTSVFKFYSNESCQIFKEGKLVGSIERLSDEPYYLPVPRKGDYRFKVVNSITEEEKTIKVLIDAEDEKEIEIEWTVQKKNDKNAFYVNVNNLKINMLRIKGGSMSIAATTKQDAETGNNKQSFRTISLPTFYISQFPITQPIWESVMGYNNSFFADREQALILQLVSTPFNFPVYLAYKSWMSIKHKVTSKVKQRIKNRLLAGDFGHFPVENITFNEAQEFVNKLSNITGFCFSLPTEDEWEYAARGGQESEGYMFAGSNNINEVAWYNDNSSGATHHVGGKKPNELGLFDMSGNIAEWTETPSYPNEHNFKESTAFICRGGSWRHDAKNCLISSCYAFDRFNKSNGLGLRVVIRKM